MITKENTYRFWFTWDLQKLCIENDYFNAGTNRQYEDFFEFIKDNKPTDHNINIAAAMIYDHTQYRDGLTPSIIARQIKEGYLREVPCEELDEALGFNKPLKTKPVKTVDTAIYYKALRNLKKKVKKILEKHGMPERLVEIFEFEEVEFDEYIHLEVLVNAVRTEYMSELKEYAQALQEIAQLVEGFKYNGFKKVHED